MSSIFNSLNRPAPLYLSSFVFSYPLCTNRTNLAKQVYSQYPEKTLYCPASSSRPLLQPLQLYFYLTQTPSLFEVLTTQNQDGLSPLFPKLYYFMLPHMTFLSHKTISERKAHLTHSCISTAPSMLPGIQNTFNKHCMYSFQKFSVNSKTIIL